MRSPPASVLLTVVVVLTAGCVGASAASTQTPGAGERVETTPDPKVVRLTNTGVATETVVVRVRMNGAVVHNETYTLEPGGSRTVYDTATVDPDGSERFALVVTNGNRTERGGIRTNACYGNVEVVVSESSLGFIQSVC